MEEAVSADEHMQALDSRQLLVFYTLARTGSFTVAAREIHLSPSAVSHSLKALEVELGHRLFNRVGKKVNLTTAGEHLLHYAERILGDMTKARKSLDQLARWGRGRLRVAAADSICQYFIPSVLSAFQKDFPDLPISIATADTRQSVEALRQHRVDMAIAIAPSQAEAVEIIPLFTDELHWIVPPLHPWALNDEVQLNGISRQRLIFNTATSHTFRLVEKYFERDGLRLSLDLEVDNFEAVKEMVRSGHGITVMAPWMAGKELADGTLAALPLGKRRLKRNWSILRSLDSKAGLAEETFVKLCHQTVSSLGSGPVVSPLGLNLVQAPIVAAAFLLDWAQPLGDMVAGACFA